ncbi:MAG: lysophospholipase [Acidobacteria bacterium]|nr:MAG: lysophospholipase [Acidobacteriota bacterium]
MIFLYFVLVYLFLALLFTFLVHRFPRNPVVDPPDWGTIVDTRIPASDGGFLEAWKITPEQGSRGTVVLAHGWGRNRDRMVNRGRVFGKMGYTVVVYSARDHGNSSKKTMMNTVCFAEDVQAVLNWAGASEKEPVILYGHSAGSAGAALAASRVPEKVKLLFLEGCFPDTREARLSLYRWFHPLFGYPFGPAIVFFARLYFNVSWPEVSPGHVAKRITCPVMVIHGAKDRQFPVSFAVRLRACFDHVPNRLFIAPQAGHSDSSEDPGYLPAVVKFMEANGLPTSISHCSR